MWLLYSLRYGKSLRKISVPSVDETSTVVSEASNNGYCLIDTFKHSSIVFCHKRQAEGFGRIDRGEATDIQWLLLQARIPVHILVLEPQFLQNK